MRAKTTLLVAVTVSSFLFFLWTTKLGLLAAMQDLAFCSEPKNVHPVLLDRPLPFPFPCPFLLFTWRPLNVFGLPSTLSVVPCPET